MFYALYQYKTRQNKLNAHKNSLEARGVSFEDLNGAYAMLLFVFVAVGVNLCLNLFPPPLSNLALL